MYYIVITYSYIYLGLESCTEDGAKNPPLVIAARYPSKIWFQNETIKEATADRRMSMPIVKIETLSKLHDAPEKRVSGNRSDTTFGMRVLFNKGRVENIAVQKDRPGIFETIFHVLLQNKVKVNSQNNAGMTALHAACDRGCTAMVKVLLQCEGIDVDKKDEQQNTPLHTACVRGEKDIVFALIEAGAEVMVVNKDGMNPLQVAVVERKLEIVKTILDLYTGIKKTLLQSKVYGNTPFLLAVKTGDEEMVKYFMENGADIKDHDHKGATALHLATSLNKVGIMKSLHEAGAKQNLYTMELLDYNHLRPLHYAAKYNSIEALEFLLN